MDDCGGELEALLHAGGIGFDFAIARFAEADVIEDFVGALHGVVGMHADEFTGVGDEFDAYEVREKALIFGGETDLAADFELVFDDVEAEDLGGTGVEGDEAQERADHGCFAGAVGAEEADGAGRDGDGEIVEGGDGAVGFCDAFELEKGGGRVGRHGRGYGSGDWNLWRTGGN